MSYQIGESIPLVYRRIDGGQAKTGLSVSVVVRSLPSGSIVLSSQSLVEVSSGLYSYSWVGSATKGHFLASYSEGGKIYDEFIDVESFDGKIVEVQNNIVDLRNDIDSSEGRAT